MYDKNLVPIVMYLCAGFWSFTYLSSVYSCSGLSMMIHLVLQIHLVYYAVQSCSALLLYPCFPFFALFCFLQSLLMLPTLVWSVQSVLFTIL